MFATAFRTGRLIAFSVAFAGIAAQAFAGTPQDRLKALPEGMVKVAPIAGTEKVNFSAEAVPVGRLVLPTAAPASAGAPVFSAAAHEQVIALTDPKVLHRLPGSPFAQIFAQMKPIAAPLDGQPTTITTDVLVASARN